MKKYGTLIALAVAIIFGIAAVFLANQWMSARVTDQKVVIKEQAPMAKIVIAGLDLDMGTLLSEKNLSLVAWPKANIPKGAFTSLDSIVGRVASTKVIAGTPLIDRQLAAPGSGVGLVASIKPGKRAMTIRVDEVVGVGGFILPNTFVDILSVQGKGKVAETVFKRIEVLAIAQETFVEEGKAKVVRTVTLELTPKQAERMAEVTHKGPIHMVLLNPAEEDFMPPEKPAPPPVAKKATPKKRVSRPVVKAPPPTHDIVVIRGTQSVETVKLTTTD